MKLFGWLVDVFRRDLKDDSAAIRKDLREVTTLSKTNQDRIDRIVDIEKVRLRNLELRAEVLTRARVRADG